MYFPIILNLADRPVVVIGGGDVAEGKVRSLMECGAHVHMVSPIVTPGLRALSETGAISLREGRYESSDLADAFLVIAATGDSSVQERIWNDARARRVLINTVDEPQRCDFIMPSVIRRNDLIVAVSTSGRSPAFAAWLRRRIAEFVTADFGRVVSVLGYIRGYVRRRCKAASDRKRAYERIIESGIVDWIGSCDDATAIARAKEIVQP